jgi:CRISPR system Cascade subunit CasB
MNTSGRDERFVARVIECCGRDKGLAARLRRADNPATEHQIWEFLIGSGLDIEKDSDRLPFATIACAMARAKVEVNGQLALGQALAKCFENGNENDSAKAHLRRLLAADSQAELCRLLRPIHSLIMSRISQPLDYVQLLNQLRRFGYGDEEARKVKVKWAQGFYRKTEEQAEPEQERP